MARGASSSGDGGGWVGDGAHSPKPHKNSRTIRVRGRAVLFPPPGVSGFLCADRQAGGIRQGCPPPPPSLPTAFKASFPLTHQAAPRLISVTSTAEGQGFLYPSPVFFGFFSPSGQARCRSGRWRAPFSQHFAKIIRNKLNMQQKITIRAS